MNEQPEAEEVELTTELRFSLPTPAVGPIPHTLEGYPTFRIWEERPCPSENHHGRLLRVKT